MLARKSLLPFVALEKKKALLLHWFSSSRSFNPTSSARDNNLRGRRFLLAANVVPLRAGLLEMFKAGCLCLWIGEENKYIYFFLKKSSFVTGFIPHDSYLTNITHANVQKKGAVTTDY